MGRLIREFRLSLGITATQFAQKLGVSSQSVHRWEKGVALPRLAQAHKFEQLFKDEAESGTSFTQLKVTEGLIDIEGRKIAIRPWSYLIELQRRAKEVWILKCNREFLAGWDGQTRREIIACLESNKKLTYNYFFCDPGDPNDAQHNPAKETFKTFRGDLEKDYSKEISDRVKGYCLDYTDRVELKTREERMRHVIELGLTPTYATWIVIVYEDARDRTIHRNIDIFAELPAATYAEFPASPSGLPEMIPSDDEYLVWFELPQRRADKLWRRWSKLRDDHALEWTFRGDKQ